VGSVKEPSPSAQVRRKSNLAGSSLNEGQTGPERKPGLYCFVCPNFMIFLMEDVSVVKYVTSKSDHGPADQKYYE
jgi:hypothetical protein